MNTPTVRQRAVGAQRRRNWALPALLSRLSWVQSTAIVGAMWFASSLVAVAQDGLPADWQSWPAEEFLDHADALLAAADADQRQAVVAHAWNTFLNNPEFVSGGDWNVVQEMVSQFAPLSGERSDGDAAQIGADSAQLRTRLESRLQGEPTLVANQPFAALKQLVDSLYRAGYQHRETAPYFAQWMDANDWRSLPMGDMVDLSNHLGWADRVDALHMSARWTGSIVAPTSGSYTFQLVRPYYRDPRYKLWIDGRLALDSQAATDRSAEFLESKPIDLTAGEAASFQLEMINDTEEAFYSRGAPAAALLWRLGDGPRRFVPSAAFSPPADFSAQPHGLKGEYFSDAALGELAVERLDDSLQFAWTWQQVASERAEHYEEVCTHCFAQLLDETISAEEQGPDFCRPLCHFAGLMPVPQRQRLVQQLIGRTDLLASLSDHHVSQLMYAFYMLPDDEHLELLAAWAESRPQPRFHAGNLDGHGAEFFPDNWEYYELIGTFLQGPYWADVEKLLDDHLQRADGECNLSLIYAAAFAANKDAEITNQPRNRRLRERIESHLEDESLSGDARVTWLIAKNFVAEAEQIVAYRPRLLRDRDALIEATLAADGDDYRFWALQELAVRYAAHGDTEGLDSLLNGIGEQFAAAEQRQAMEQWRAIAAELKTVYRQQQERERAAVAASYLLDLEKRLAQAQASQDEADIARYEQLIDSAKGASAEN